MCLNKWIGLLVLVTHAAFCFGQNSILVRSGAGYFDSHFGEKGLWQTATTNRAFSLSNTLEVIAQRKLKHNHCIGVGVMYERITYLQKNVPIIDFTSSFSASTPTSMGNYKGVFSSLLTPLYFHFYFDKKGRFFAGPSLAQRFLLLSSTKSTFKTADGAELFQKQSFQGFNLSAAVGLESGYQFQFKNGDALQLTAFAKTYLQRATFALRYYTYFYGIGVGYNFTHWIKKSE